MADDLIRIRSFATRFEAEMAQTYLQSSNIPAMVSADDAAGLDPFLLVGSGGAFVVVRSGDAEIAAQLLDDYLGAEYDSAANKGDP
jgi:hypothetical protein